MRNKERARESLAPVLSIKPQTDYWRFVPEELPLVPLPLLLEPAELPEVLPVPVLLPLLLEPEVPKRPELVPPLLDGVSLLDPDELLEPRMFEPPVAPALLESMS